MASGRQTAPTGHTSDGHSNGQQMRNVGWASKVPTVPGVPQPGRGGPAPMRAGLPAQPPAQPHYHPHPAPQQHQQHPPPLIGNVIVESIPQNPLGGPPKVTPPAGRAKFNYRATPGPPNPQSKMPPKQPPFAKHQPYHAGPGHPLPVAAPKQQPIVQPNPPQTPHPVQPQNNVAAPYAPVAPKVSVVQHNMPPQRPRSEQLEIAQNLTADLSVDDLDGIDFPTFDGNDASFINRDSAALKNFHARPKPAVAAPLAPAQPSLGPAPVVTNSHPTLAPPKAPSPIPIVPAPAPIVAKPPLQQNPSSAHHQPPLVAPPQPTPIMAPIAAPAVTVTPPVVAAPHPAASKHQTNPAVLPALVGPPLNPQQSAEIDALKKQLENMNSEKKTSIAETANLRRRIDFFEKEIETLKSKLRTKELESQKLANMEDLIRNNDVLKHSVNKLTADQTGLKDELKFKESEIVKTTAEIEELKRKVDLLTKEIDRNSSGPLAVSTGVQAAPFRHPQPPPQPLPQTPPPIPSHFGSQQFSFHPTPVPQPPPAAPKEPSRVSSLHFSPTKQPKPRSNQQAIATNDVRADVTMEEAGENASKKANSKKRIRADAVPPSPHKLAKYSESRNQDEESMHLSRKIVSVSASVSGLLSSANQLYQKIRQRSGAPLLSPQIDSGPLIAIQTAIGAVTNGIEDPLFLLIEIQKHLLSRSTGFLSGSSNALLRRSSKTTLPKPTTEAIRRRIRSEVSESASASDIVSLADEVSNDTLNSNIVSMDSAQLDAAIENSAANDYAAEEAVYDQYRREAGFTLLVPVLASCKHARLAVLGKNKPATESTANFNATSLQNALASNPRVSFKRKNGSSQPTQSQPNAIASGVSGAQLVSLRMADPHLRLLDHVFDIFKECIESPRIISNLLRVYYILMSECDHTDMMRFKSLLNKTGGISDVLRYHAKSAEIRSVCFDVLSALIKYEPLAQIALNEESHALDHVVTTFSIASSKYTDATRNSKMLLEMKLKAIRLLSLVLSSHSRGLPFLLSMLKESAQSTASTRNHSTSSSSSRKSTGGVEHALDSSYTLKASSLLSRLAMHLYEEVVALPGTTDIWEVPAWFKTLSEDQVLTCQFAYIHEVLLFMDQVSRNFPDLLRAQVVRTLGNQFWSVLYRLLSLCDAADKESQYLTPEIVTLFKQLRSSTVTLEKVFSKASDAVPRLAAVSQL